MIKNIIFDFGDIFINLDKKATSNEFQKLGITEVSSELKSILNQYEEGIISTDDFIAFFEHNYKVTAKEVVFAWNAILLNFPKHRLKFLKDLAASNQFRLFLLSNTNDLHIANIKEKWGAVLYDEFKNCFEQFYLSYEIHLSKPNSAIYQFVLDKNNLKAHETLFVDDLKENTDAASKLGISTWNLLPGKDDVTDLFIKNKNIF